MAGDIAQRAADYWPRMTRIRAAESEPNPRVDDRARPVLS